MLVRPITYTDLDGETQTDNFHFNLTISEVTEIELEMDGGLSEHLIEVIQEKNARELLAIYKLLITKAYGERSEDGKYFLKETDEGRSLGKRFVQHPAYDALFFELMGADDTNDDAFMTFLEGCLPKELLEKMPDQADVPKILEERRLQKEATGSTKKVTDYSREELLAMSNEEFDKVAGTNSQDWPPEILQVAFLRKSANNAK